MSVSYYLLFENDNNKKLAVYIGNNYNKIDCNEIDEIEKLLDEIDELINKNSELSDTKISEITVGQLMSIFEIFKKLQRILYDNTISYAPSYDMIFRVYGLVKILQRNNYKLIGLVNEFELPKDVEVL